MFTTERVYFKIKEQIKVWDSQATDTSCFIFQRRQKHYNPEKEMYIFNRNRVMFEWILFYYQSHGDLYIPKVRIEIICFEISYLIPGDPAINTLIGDLAEYGPVKI